MIANQLVKVLAVVGSSASIGFGIWHLFVPWIWKWYSYMDATATELIVAVRAINAFFSVSLVLFGIVNLLLVCGDRSDRYSSAVVLSATCILWLTRVACQVVYPQGSAFPGLQYGMLSAFVLVALCYTGALIGVLLQENPA